MHEQRSRFPRWLGRAATPVWGNPRRREETYGHSRAWSAAHRNCPASLAGWISRYFASVSHTETGGGFTPCSTRVRQAPDGGKQGGRQPTDISVSARRRCATTDRAALLAQLDLGPVTWRTTERANAPSSGTRRMRSRSWEVVELCTSSSKARCSFSKAWRSCLRCIVSQRR